MKNNTPPVSEPVSPLIWKLILIGGGILIMVMFVLTTRSIICVFCSSASSPAAVQTNTMPVVVHPQPSAETPPLSANSNPEVFLSSQPTPPAMSTAEWFAVQNEIMKQREKARVETIEVLKREAQEQAGTSGVPKEVLQKLEQSDPYIL